MQGGLLLLPVNNAVRVWVCVDATGLAHLDGDDHVALSLNLEQRLRRARRQRCLQLVSQVRLVAGEMQGVSKGV